MIPQTEALKLALEALEGFYEYGYDRRECFEHVTAIKEALAQPKEPDPVAWMIWGKNNVPSLTFKKPSDKYVFDSLYTTPPQRKPLTKDDIRAIGGIVAHDDVFFINIKQLNQLVGIKELV
jgi:hypothetical protein